MRHPLTDIEPREVWDHFYKLTQIPRPSRGERTICRYIYDMAQNMGLEVSMDTAGGPDFGNIIVKCPAAPGYERAPITVLQSHVDMVALPEERKSLPLDLILDGAVLRARGTTLGADNGIAVAMALSLMTRPDIVHGPLELLFTTNEEAGMTGVLSLSETALEGRFLINIDSEEEGVLTICSAGACHSVLQLPLEWKATTDGLAAVHVAITGGKGGHSGLEINSGRANVGQLLARALYEESKTFDLYLNDLAWGNVMNAIPSEARAVILIKPECMNDLKGALSEWQKVFSCEFGRFEGFLQVLINEDAHQPEYAISVPTTEKVLSFLLALPHGVYTMSGDIPGLVETSANVAVVSTSRREMTVTVSQRSLTDPSLDAVITRCEAVANLAGAEFTHIGRSYGWKPNPASYLLAVCRDAYWEIFGEEPKVTGLHAMLECGFIKAKYPDMDMISIGPTIWDAHAPTKDDYAPGADSDTAGERIDTARMPRFWEFVKTILKRLAELER